MRTLYFNKRNHYRPLMQKKRTKQLKTLRLRKEALQVLTTEQQLRIHAGSDPWGDTVQTQYPICQNA